MTLGAGLGYTRHHKIPASQLKGAWNSSTIAERRHTVTRSLQTMIEGGDEVRNVAGAGAVTTRQQQLNALSGMDPRQAYVWFPDNITVGRDPQYRTVALGRHQDPGNNLDPARMPPAVGASHSMTDPPTPRSSIVLNNLTGVPNPTGVQVAQIFERMATTPRNPTNSLGPTRYTNPSLTSTHN